MEQIGDWPGRVVSQQLDGPGGRDQLGQPVGHEVMLLVPLLGDDRLDQDAEACVITTLLRLDEVDDQV